MKKTVLRGLVKLLSHFEYILQIIVVYETKTSFLQYFPGFFLNCQILSPSSVYRVFFETIYVRIYLPIKTEYDTVWRNGRHE